MARSLPGSVTGREVIFGGGLHAAIYAATRVAMGYDPPIVFEQNLATGGVFAQLLEFRMNSVNGASVQSVASPSPSRVVPMSASDDLNWIPNSAHQVRDLAGGKEYPSSADMCRAIQRTLKENAEIYTGTEEGMKFDRYARVYTKDSVPLGAAKRVIFAGGLVPRDGYKTGPAVMSGFDFLRKPVSDMASIRVAIVGSGDTAAQVAEYMLGQGIITPSTTPRQIHWYGDTEMPTTKSDWMARIHARWSGLGRHLPQQDGVYTGVIRPYAVRGNVVSLGRSAMVNGQVYDMAVMCTGVKPAPCPTIVQGTYSVGGMTVAKSNSSETADGIPKVFTIGTAAGLGQRYRPYQSRFTAASEAIYNLGPRTAVLAAYLDR
jgi:hypothetical protein